MVGTSLPILLISIQTQEPSIPLLGGEQSIEVPHAPDYPYWNIFLDLRYTQYLTGLQKPIEGASFLELNLDDSSLINQHFIIWNITKLYLDNGSPFVFYGKDYNAMPQKWQYLIKDGETWWICLGDSQIP